MYPETVVYGEVLGAGLLADIAVPDGQGPFAIILSVHGGGWIGGNRKDDTAIDVREWAGYGFFAMSIDYRLVTCTPAPACYQDFLCAIRWVHAHREEYRLDTDSLFLIGMSAGGQLISLAATLGEERFGRSGGWEDQSHTFTAAISVSGAYELRRPDWGSRWAPLGEHSDKARLYASPIEHVAADNRPLLIMHSEDDGSVPIQQALDMVEAMQDAGATHEFVHYTDRGHMRIDNEVVAQSRAFIERLRAKQPNRGDHER